MLLSKGTANFSARKITAPRYKSSISRSEEHTSELQSQSNVVCRLLLEKKKHRRRRRSPDPRPGRHRAYTTQPLDGANLNTGRLAESALAVDADEARTLLGPLIQAPILG